MKRVWASWACVANFGELNSIDPRHTTKRTILQIVAGPGDGRRATGDGCRKVISTSIKNAVDEFLRWFRNAYTYVFSVLIQWMRAKQWKSVHKCVWMTEITNFLIFSRDFLKTFTFSFAGRFLRRKKKQKKLPSIRRRGILDIVKRGNCNFQFNQVK